MTANKKSNKRRN